MAGELLDFSIRSVIHFADSVSEAKKTLLTETLNTIRAQGHVVVRDFCILGQRLKELRDGGLWRNVLDQNGQRYDADSFYAFCEDVLGFSKTKTQNMISLSAFVRYKNGDKNDVEFISDAYSEYNTSQLVELSSVFDFQRRCFSPSMSVRDMRLVKSYIRMHSSSGSPEEILDRARKDAQQKETLQKRLNEETQKASQVEQLSFSSDNAQICNNAIYEYLEMWPFYVELRREILSAFFKDRDRAVFGEMIRRIVPHGNQFKYSTPVGSVQGSWWVYGDEGYKSVRFTVQNPIISSTETWNLDRLVRALTTLIVERKYGLPHEYPSNGAEVLPALDEVEVVSEDSSAEEELLDEVEDVQESVPASSNLPFYKNWDLNNRAGRRLFLSEYQKWTRNPNPTEFSFFAKDVYSIYFPPLGITLYAVETMRLAQVTDCVCEPTVLYYIYGNGFSDKTIISKEQLDEYLVRRLYKL